MQGLYRYHYISDISLLPSEGDLTIASCVLLRLAKRRRSSLVAYQATCHVLISDFRDMKRLGYHYSPF